jgi:hypothetical protein
LAAGNVAASDERKKRNTEEERKSQKRGRMTMINGKQPITKKGEKGKREIDFSHISTLFSLISHLI